MKPLWLVLALTAACGGGDNGTPSDAAAGDGQAADGRSADAAQPDLDQDGLPDSEEAQVAADYLPYISLASDDGCKLMGIVYRVRKHPQSARCLHVIWDLLYQRDCGSFGGIGAHAGDDEVVSATIDPAMPAPAGIRNLKAISHQNTACQRVSECGAGQTACATLMKGGVAWPAVWPSKDKHGNYLNRAQTCTTFGTCADSCADNATPDVPPMQNAGEPGHELTRNLTMTGFITSANGWTDTTLFDYDPWGGSNFGGAGNVAGDLVDPAFDTPACP